MGKLSFIRALTLAAASSGVLCFTTSSNSEKLLSVSLVPPKPDSLTWPWRTMQVNSFHEFTPLNPSQHGFLPLFFSSPNAFPGADISKSATNAGDCPRQSCNCFSVDTIPNAAAKVGPAVVNLSVPQGFSGMTMGKSVGSGTIIDEDGTILTCAHVVVDFRGLRSSSKGKVEVTLQDGRTFEGTVVNADLHSDIALVKIKSKTRLPTAKLGSSSKLRPGDLVVAMGCPLTLQNTVTAVSFHMPDAIFTMAFSCVDRKSSDLGLGGFRREYLQTDCAINEGNSGGPLVNVYGEIVGVNIMKVLGADGLNFAVPIDSVSTIIEHFKRNGRVVRTWLGLKMIDLNDMITAQLKDKNPAFPDVNKGLLVSMIEINQTVPLDRDYPFLLLYFSLQLVSVPLPLIRAASATVIYGAKDVSPGSPADRAGFHPGDVVVEFGGKPVGSIKEVIEIMGDKVGKPFIAVVKRANNTTRTLTVIPEEADPDM